MRKKLFLLVFFLVLILFAIISIMLQRNNKEKQNQVCFKNYCFNVELAISPEERTKGLMFRKSLGDKNGMLFIFEKEARHSFWMKNTLISLDIIWIDENSKIIFINENTQPCKNSFCPSVDSGKKAKYVLEINAGIAENIGLAVGDKVKIEYSK
ncbi:MAG: DUF192 domain-containing protein [Patescibacteria group bacterium]|nr:DUF192 domain-containing protein [Patescibacteria group bacterium]